MEGNLNFNGNPDYISEEHVRRYIKFHHSIAGPIGNAELTMAQTLEQLALYAYSQLPVAKFTELQWSDLENYLPGAFLRSINVEKSKLTVQKFSQANEFRFHVRYSMAGIPIVQKVEFYMDTPELD